MLTLLKISIASKTKKHDPTYYLAVEVTNAGSTPSSWQIKAPFTTWFTADGYFVAKPFQQWLATSIEAIGDVDVKSASREEGDGLASPGVEKVAAGQSNGSAVEATGAEIGKGGSNKRSKRK